MTTSFPPISYPSKPVPPFTAEPPKNPFPGFFPDMWKNITGKPYITVSSKGLANGLSEYFNDGADFGPDSLQADGSLTQTGGIMEAKESLPKIYNSNSGRYVPIGTIEIYFSGKPITIETPIIIYDDEFVTLTSPDSWATTFDVPESLTNAGGYITNKNSTSVLQILRNPANISQGWGRIELLNLTFINTYSTTANTFPIVYCGPNTYSTTYSGDTSTDPYPSVLHVDKLNIIDNYGNQPLLYLTTPGYEQLFDIGTVYLYGASGAYNMMTVAASHIKGKYIYIYSNGYADPTEDYTGFMLRLGVGQDCHIGTYHFNFNGNGILFTTGLGGQQGAMTIIDVIRDEMLTINYGIDQNGNHITMGSQTGIEIGYYSGSASGTPLGMSVLNSDSNFIAVRHFPQFRGDSSPNNIFLQPSTPSVPSSGTAQSNSNPYAVKVYVNGGAVTEIQITINGTAYTVFSNSTGLALSGQSYKLNPGDSITITYTTAPDWTWL